MRETFLVKQMQNAGHAIFYSRVGDFKMDGHFFEVGGKHKNKRQINHEHNAFILSGDIIVGSRAKIPLYLFGFLY